MNRALPLAGQIIFATALGLMIAFTLVNGPGVSADRAPMQWSANGAPTWYGPRLLSLWLLVAITAAAGLVIALTARSGSTLNTRSLWWLLILLSIGMSAVHIWHVTALVRWSGG